MKKYPITIDIEYSKRLSRLTTFFRCIMIIPQYFVLFFVEIAAYVVLFIAWWAILFMGRYPKWAFNFNAGFLRWAMRVSGYFLLLTDKYPPFSMSK